MSTDDPAEIPPPDHTESTDPRNGAASVRVDARAGRHAHPRIPKAIEHRYLRVDNRYFFPDRTLAFIDDGGRLRVRTENREVLHTAVAIAEARGWRVIELRGTEAFRQGMWREAALRGIEVRGYAPTQTEMLQMQRALRARQFPQEMQRDPPPTARARETSAAREDVVPPESDQRFAQRSSDARRDHSFGHREPRTPIRGTLMSAAAASYWFDPAQRMSFYVTVRTEAGDRTVWGADLERALAESASQPRIGDEVVLTRHGTRPVNIRVAARDADGELVGEKKIPAQRARWSVETSDHRRAMERRASQVRTGELLSEPDGARDPELAEAAANLRLAEQYARRVTGDEASRQQLLQLIREQMAEALAQGRAIHLPDRRLGPAPMRARHRTGRSPEELNHERV
jgi:Large polyvalent protein-associated domain 7